MQITVQLLILSNNVCSLKKTAMAVMLTLQLERENTMIYSLSIQSLRS